MVFSTQESIEIAGIRDGIVINKDGSYRLILNVAATNFALKSENEQNALIFQYQSFLNSLHFPVEIVIRSKRLDLTPYLAKIKGVADKQQNDLIRLQSLDYIDFVGKLINIANIMKKTFFVVVSFSTITAPKQVNIIDKLFGTKQAQVFDHIKISDTEYKNATEKLIERANNVASGLGSLGLHCSQMSTEDIVELFYEIYNPGESSKERLSNAGDLASSVITSSISNPENVVDEDLAENSMIDNSDLVIEKQRQDAELRRQENAGVSETELANQLGTPTGDVIPVAPDSGTLANPASSEAAMPPMPQANQSNPSSNLDYGADVEIKTPELQTAAPQGQAFNQASPPAQSGVSAPLANPTNNQNNNPGAGVN